MTTRRTAILLAAAGVAVLLAALLLATWAGVTHFGGIGRAPAGPSLTITQTKLGNVFLDAETPRFTISTGGQAISWSVRNVWKKEVASGGAPVLGHGYQLTLPHPLGEKGWFYLAVQAHGAGGGRTERGTSFAVLSSTSLSPAADSPFGYAAHIGELNPASTFPLLAQSGVKAVRTDLYWSIVEKSAGVYDFSYYDRYLAGLRQQTGASPDLILAYTNPLYAGNVTPYDSTSLTAWAKFAAAAAAHYRGLAKWVEVYNEPDMASSGPCSQSPTCYAQMLQYTYPAVKAANPDMTVIGCAAASVNLPWLEKVFKAGGLQYMDVVSVHPYRWPPAPEGVEKQLAELDALIRKYNNGKPKPIYVTEFGWSTAGGAHTVDEASQARYLVRGQVLTQSAPSVERTFVYAFINDIIKKPRWAGGFGTLRNTGDSDGAYTPKPSYVAHAVLLRALLGAQFAGRDRTPSEVYSYRYDDGQREVHVMWAPWPAGVTLHTASPVTVTDEMGNSTTHRPKGRRIYLSLSQDPVYVTGSFTTRS